MENKVKQEKRTYCAIYTRKSTSEGLAQDFTSLDAQRESAENYINSQKHEGWVVVPETYDDGGFTGANIERPGLQKLLSDIKDRKIDCVVVYKVDRLSRSLMDFAQLLEFFDKNNVTFVSVTQAFNTNTSMGRLTLNILLSFAQFEREIISERTKDKMGAARKRGQWLGGKSPMGYDRDPQTKKLVINQEEAKIIREIFNLYLKSNSLLEVVQILNDKGYRTKVFISKKGKRNGGIKFSVTYIQTVVKNILYMGKVSYAGQIYDGQQEAIIDEETFKKTQEKLKQNRIERKATKNTECTGLLSKLLRCTTCKSVMFHTYTLKDRTRRYRYYACSSAQKRGYNSCPTKSVNAQAIEDALVGCLKRICTDNIKKNGDSYKQEIKALLSPVWDTLFPQEKRRILRSLIKEIDYSSSTKKLGIVLNGSNLRLEFDIDLAAVRAKTCWRKEDEVTKEPKIRRILALAHQVQQLIDQGTIKHPRQACKWLNFSVTRMDQIMNTLFLCPSIQMDIFSLNTPAIQTLTEYSVRPLVKEVLWDKQMSQWQALLSTNR